MTNQTQPQTAAQIYHEQTGRESYTREIYPRPYAAYVGWLERIAVKSAEITGTVPTDGDFCQLHAVEELRGIIQEGY